MENNMLNVSASDKLLTISNFIETPLKWDAEHPNLYSLEVSLLMNNRTVYSETLNIGFRDVRVVGNQFLVNWMPVVMRGSNRHSIHPLLGRATDNDYDDIDIDGKRRQHQFHPDLTLPTNQRVSRILRQIRHVRGV